MYLSFYHLKHKPFQIDTDPRFLWLGEKHKEAMATLKYGVLDSRGFLLLTGDVGTGKTTLINGLLRTLDKKTSVAFIRDPGLEPLDFLIYTAHAFGMDAGAVTSKASFLIQFEKFLWYANENNRRLLLIIDEAQRMTQELLEEVRLLSNIDKEEDKLLSIFFVGQIEFNDKLLQYENRALRQRIAINYNIDTLTESETREYIKHRLRVSATEENVGFFAPVGKKADGKYGQQGMRLPLPEVLKDVFSEDALHSVYEFSKGYPRLINIICDRALLTGYLEEAAVITQKHIQECTKELEIPHQQDHSTRNKQYQARMNESVEKLSREVQGRRSNRDAQGPPAPALVAADRPEATRNPLPQNKEKREDGEELRNTSYLEHKSKRHAAPADNNEDQEITASKGREGTPSKPDHATVPPEQAEPQELPDYDEAEEMSMSEVQSSIKEMLQEIEGLVDDFNEKDGGATGKEQTDKIDSTQMSMISRALKKIFRPS